MFNMHPYRLQSIPDLRDHIITYLVRYLYLFILTFTVLVIYNHGHVLVHQSTPTGQDSQFSDGYLTSHHDYVDLTKQLTHCNSTDYKLSINYCDAYATSRNKHLKDIILLSSDRELFDFKRCTMSNCFDIDRCDAQGPIKVHIVPSETDGTRVKAINETSTIHEAILKVIRSSQHHEADASKACLFISEDDLIDRDPLSPNFRSYAYDVFNMSNYYGMNYIMFNLYSGTWPDYREDDFGNMNVGAAIVAKASNSQRHHRSKFDISLPLFAYDHPLSKPDKLMNDNIDRSFFLTFKGKRYVIGQGSETRNSLRHIDNDRDVVILTTCRHGKNWKDAIDDLCDKDDSRYSTYDFIDLMKNSTFCLTPRGRRLGSFRFLEALQYACIPVIMSDGWVQPFDELIDWNCAAVQIDEQFLPLVADTLRDVERDIIEAARRRGQAIYANHLASIEQIILSTLEIVQRRVESLKKCGVDVESASMQI